MKTPAAFIFLLIIIAATHSNAQVNNLVQDSISEHPLSILPVDGVLQMAKWTSIPVPSEGSRAISFKPTANFFFRPETTSHYKEAGMAEDTGHLNFYLRGDFGGKIMLPKNIDMVFNLQSYGVYRRSFGPLDQTLSLYEAYADMKKLDRNGNLSLRVGRMCLGKYGNEILVGDDDFIRGRSFESVRFRYLGTHSTHDWIWAQLYQQAPDSVNFDWNHPIFLSTFNTFNFSDAFNLDANLPYIIDQYNSGFRTSVLMPDARIFGHTDALRYSAELIYQTGTTKGITSDDKLGNVNAYAAEISAGYFTFQNKFGVDVSYYRASGDDDASDNDIHSYNVLWQNEHRRFGFIDAFKGSNLQAATLHINWNPKEQLSTGIHATYASVLEQNDRSTGIATGPLNNINTSSTSIGVGGDWYLNYYYNSFLNMQLSVSAFSPGEYFTEVNGIDKTMLRMYLMLAVRV